jgi:hypothetical protein
MAAERDGPSARELVQSSQWFEAAALPNKQALREALLSPRGTREEL